jgi:hypothetical protein
MATVNRKRVRRPRYRHGGVRPLFWPFGDYMLSRTDTPSGYWRSVRWGMLFRLIAVWSGVLAVVIVIAGAIASR